MNKPGENHWPKRKPPIDDGMEAMDAERLERFPQLLSSSAQIASHQLGWRMVVLPFRVIGSPVGYGLSLGMAEEISAALSRFRSPRLIAPATFWDGAGPVADALSQCRLYRLDYILDGTIQVFGDELHVNVTLSDAVLDFEVIWSGSIQGRLDDLFSVQEKIALETVAQLDPDLSMRGSAFEPPVKTKIAAAHHCVLTAIQGIFRLDRPKFMRARDLLLRATDLDPGYAAAHAWLAYWGIMAVGQGWVENPGVVTSFAGDAAERAIKLDPFDARALGIAGHVTAYLFHRVRDALAMHVRAIELNPNLPIVWTLSSWSKIYIGDHATAVRHAMTSQSLSPRDPHVFFAEHASMTAHFFQGNLDEAEALAEVVLTRNPLHVSALNVQLAILGHMDRREEANACLTILKELDPSISIFSIVARAPLREEDREFYAEGLRRAGVPAGEP